MPSRRLFLTLSLATCGAALCGSSSPCAWAEAPWNRDKLLKDFQGVAQGAEASLRERLGPQVAHQAALDAVAKFEELIPGLPDVGGDSNPISQFIPKAAWYVALYSVLKKHGFSAEDVGKLLYDMNARGLQGADRERMLAGGARLFEAQEETRVWAESSHKRRYPADWVMDFVPGDGQTFDFGYDMRECACLKYFHSQGVAEVAPYMCLNDFLLSRAMGTGLVRDKTLAQGDDRCNFRYKRGREVTQSWATEIDLIRKRMQP